MKKRLIRSWWAIALRREIADKWLLGLSGVASLVFGLMIAALPAVGLLVILSLIAADAITAGILLIGFGLQLQRMALTRRRIVAAAHSHDGG